MSNSVKSVVTMPTSGHFSVACHCSASFSLSQTSSASRKAIQGCEVAWMPAFRAPPGPPTWETLAYIAAAAAIDRHVANVRRLRAIQKQAQRYAASGLPKREASPERQRANQRIYELWGVTSDRKDFR